MWWWIFLIVPAYFVQTFTHEGGHGFFHLLAGRQITSFKVWPHFVAKDHDNDPKTPDRLFYFWGRIVSISRKGEFTTEHERIMMHFGPWLVGVPVWVGLAVAIWLGSPSWLLIFLGSTTIDLSRASLQPWWTEERGDANRGAVALGLSRGILKACGAILALLLVGGCAALATLTLI